jgi:hypothetical protein
MLTDEQSIINVPMVYANNLRLGLSFSDVRLIFGEQLPSGPSPTPGVTVPAGVQTVDRVCIVLSPDLLPAVIDGLQKAVQGYQTQFGPLRKIPQAMLQPPTEPAKS